MLLLLRLLELLRNADLLREPIYRIPEPSTQQGQSNEVDAFGGDEEDEEHELQGREGDVGRNQERGGGARGEDARPELLHERSHGGEDARTQGLGMDLGGDVVATETGIRRESVEDGKFEDVGAAIPTFEIS